MPNYDYRFEMKPGKFVYVPNDETKVNGPLIVRDLLGRWTPESYFFHIGARGGHVASMRRHQSNKYKASIDLRGFFMHVTRTKVRRALERVGYSSRKAFDIAQRSCVVAEAGKHIPYGFPQSMALATLALEKSHLGSEITRLRMTGISVTMYVDDIIISSPSLPTAQEAYSAIIAAASESAFEVSEKKCSPPAESVEAFNCHITDDLAVNAERMERFQNQMNEANDFGKEAILRYIGVIKESQMHQMIALY